MPWLIQHRCTMSQPIPSEYGVMKSTHNGEAITRVVCPNENCREEFFILGHELFSEAVPNQMHSGLPPGFVIPHGRTIS